MTGVRMMTIVMTMVTIDYDDDEADVQMMKLFRGKSAVFINVTLRNSLAFSQKIS